MRIRILPFTLMRIRILITYWYTDPLRLNFESSGPASIVSVHDPPWHHWALIAPQFYHWYGSGSGLRNTAWHRTYVVFGHVLDPHHIQIMHMQVRTEILHIRFTIKTRASWSTDNSSLVGGWRQADLVCAPRWWAAWRLDLAPFAPFDVVNEKVTERKQGLVQNPNIFIRTFLHCLMLNKF